MDVFKRETTPDYTKWDLNVKIARPHNRQKLEHKLKRSARRKNNRELRKIVLDRWDNL